MRITPCLAFILLILRSESTYFCDLQAIDNVFNIGHLIYMTRCGEVWTYDPRMNPEDDGQDPRGGFIRDYSWYSLARSFFGRNVFEQKGSYEDKWLNFTAFSFQEVNCKHESESIRKDCSGSVRAWNGLSVITDKVRAETFRFETDYESLDNREANPLGFESQQNMGDSRDSFWPAIDDVAKQAYGLDLGRGKGTVHSALFTAHDSLLYIVLESPNKMYYCVTYAMLREMLHDRRKWPKEPGKKPKWAKCQPFTGNVVGMFYKENRPERGTYIAGRVKYDYRKFEDQVYTVTVGGNGGNGNGNGNGRPVPLKISSMSEGTNLRTFFGCPETQAVPTMDSFPLIGPPHRKKRAIEQKIDGQSNLVIDWNDIKQEVKQNWKSICAMAVTNIVLIVIIFRQTQRILFAKSVN